MPNLTELASRVTIGKLRKLSENSNDFSELFQTRWVCGCCPFNSQPSVELTGSYYVFANNKQLSIWQPISGAKQNYSVFLVNLN
ncbi:MAG: hypothetical protein HWE27_06005 [Gammaproteobacteria bacterium]|nr:hypothetical protein [Gammaproteobacteria bacterium]